MHLKRQKIPRKWPIARKGTKFVVRPDSNVQDGIPLLVFLRDMVKVAQNRKEVKRAIHNKSILINSKPVRDERNTVLLFDKITLVPSKKYYKLNLSKFGKFMPEEIKESESHSKIARVNDKKVLKGKKVQLNLSDGRNYITDSKCGVNDSVIVDFEKKKISKCLPLKEKAKVIIFAGKHAGKRGTVEKIKEERKMAGLSVGKEKINVLIKQIMVVE